MRTDFGSAFLINSLSHVPLPFCKADLSPLVSRGVALFAGTVHGLLSGAALGLEAPELSPLADVCSTSRHCLLNLPLVRVLASIPATHLIGSHTLYPPSESLCSVASGATASRRLHDGSPPRCRVSHR